MGMKVIYVALGEADFLALRDLAHRDRRDPRAQARVLLERALVRHRSDSREATDQQPAAVR